MNKTGVKQLFFFVEVMNSKRQEKRKLGHVVQACRKRDSRLRQTANANLYHVTKFPLYLSFTVHYFYTYISSFTQFLIHENCFELFLSAHFLF